FRRACEGPPNTTLTPGSPRQGEPWCAPRWVLQNKRQIAGWMRLSVEQTNSILWLAQSDFSRQLKVMLDEEEETAYINLARQPRDQSKQTSVKAGPHEGAQVPDLKDAASRRAAVNEYIAEVLAIKGKRITRRDIWKKAGYTSATEFQRWQRDDKRQSKAAGDNFRRILTEKPHLN
ncbi:MAG TPA: hypothetical protein VKB58_04735, partial [Terriglobales bacterium]|nr:hypothetical protein [Terriglobales bacterium]